MINPIYLDYNATTPHDPEVIEAMRLFFEKEFGNPSSGHWYGVKPKQAVENARRQVAALLNCMPEEIIFTSGGTESNNHAIKGIVLAYQNKIRSHTSSENKQPAASSQQPAAHIITTQIEHSAVLEVCRFLEMFGVETTYLPVDKYGMAEVSDVENAIRPETILISIMHANNEVGTIQPIAEIAEIARQHHILMHTDAAQSVGKIPTDVKALGVDLLSVAGHKVYAPKGVGALFIHQSVSLPKFIHGAGQESGKRAGTENVLEIVGLGKACETAMRDINANTQHMRNTRDLLYEGIRKAFPSAVLNGHPEKRLPNTLSLSFPDMEANKILEEIGLEIAASAGAACHSDSVEISHVLEAMNIPLHQTKGTLRFSTGRMTTEADISHAVNIIAEAVRKF